MEAIAVQDCFGQSALDYEQLLEHYGLTEVEIIQAVKKILG
jgi:transketolase C-terminal domain/subunit